MTHQGDRAQLRPISNPEADSARRPIVLLDCDGVLADFVSAMLRVVYEVTGEAYRPEQVTEFDFCRALGLGPTDAGNVMLAISGRRKFCARLVTYPGARDGVRRLREVADVYIVTSPWNSNETWTSEREWWLQHYFDIPHGRVIHASAKHLVRGDVFVDDKTSIVATWQRWNPDGLALRWNTPHNQRDPWDGRSTSSWDELIELVAARSGNPAGRPPVRTVQPGSDTSRIEAGLAELRDTRAQTQTVTDILARIAEIERHTDCSRDQLFRQLDLGGIDGQWFANELRELREALFTALATRPDVAPPGQSMDWDVGELG
jgi:5'(3')-deoxyribonucleotidase